MTKQEYMRRWREANPEKVKAAHARYYANHTEEHKARARQYIEARPEVKSEINRRYNNSEKGRATMAAWRDKNAVAIRISVEKRKERPDVREAEVARSRERTLSGDYRTYDQSVPGKARRRQAKFVRRARLQSGTSKDAKVAIRKILQAKKKRCFYCGRKLTLKTVTADHVRALAKQGAHAAYNLVPSCIGCNRTKGTKDPNQFITKGQQILVF